MEERSARAAERRGELRLEEGRVALLGVARVGEVAGGGPLQGAAPNGRPRWAVRLLRGVHLGRRGLQGLECRVQLAAFDLVSEAY